MILFLQILVLYVFSESLLLRFYLLVPLPFLLLHRLNHVAQLFNVGPVGLLYFLPLGGELILENVHVPSELFLESPHSGVLNREQSLNMDEVVPNRNLVLVLSLVQVLVQHLNEGLL